MAKQEEATVVVFDVSQHSCGQVQRCIESIVLQKIFTHPNDKVALFFTGNSSKNLHENKSCDDQNTRGWSEMNQVSWKMLEFIKNEFRSTGESITSNWMDSLKTAIDFFKELKLKCVSKKILLFSTFSTEANVVIANAVTKDLKQLDIQLIAITETPKQQQGNDLIMQIIDRITNGLLCSLDEAVIKLAEVDKKRRKVNAGNYNLSFGKFDIEITAYVHVCNQTEKNSWETCNSDGKKYVQRMEYFCDDKLISPEEVKHLVNGYKYGDIFVQENGSNGFGSNNKSSQGGLRVIEFKQFDEICIEDFVGEKMWLIVPKKGSTVAAKRFSALLRAMQNSKLAIIAQFASRKGVEPKLTVLFPSPNNSMEMHELLYYDNRVSLTLPLLRSTNVALNDSQLNFMDKFIDSHDLTNYKSDPNHPPTELFKKLMDPGLQHMYRSIAHRALNPNDSALKVDKEIIALISPPQKIDSTMETEMKTLFPLKAAKMTTKAACMQLLTNENSEEIKRADDKIEPMDLNGNEIPEIGTECPFYDFCKLIHAGETFTSATKKLQNVIGTLLKANDSIKFFKIIHIYREIAIKTAPNQYNIWIESIKGDLMKIGKEIFNRRLGLITESDLSRTSAKELAEFYNSINIDLNDSGNGSISSENQIEPLDESISYDM